MKIWKKFQKGNEIEFGQNEYDTKWEFFTTDLQLDLAPQLIFH